MQSVDAIRHERSRRSHWGAGLVVTGTASIIILSGWVFWNGKTSIPRTDRPTQSTQRGSSNTDLVPATTNVEGGENDPMSSLKYVDRVEPRLAALDEKAAHAKPVPVRPVPVQPGANRPAPRICLISQFDAIRTPMTLKELTGLLGDPINRPVHSFQTLYWICEDERRIHVLLNNTFSPTQSFHFQKSQIETMRYTLPELGELQMGRYLGRGKVRFFLLPDRKAGEVEEAIKRLGPGKPATSA